MKYVKVDKGDGTKREVTRDEALRWMERNYNNPQRVLEAVEELAIKTSKGEIPGGFSSLEVQDN